MSFEKRVGGIMMIFGLIMFFLSLFFIFQISYFFPEVETNLLYQSKLVSESMLSASDALLDASGSISKTTKLMNTLSLGFKNNSESMKKLSELFKNSPLLLQAAKGSDELLFKQSQDLNFMSAELESTRKSLSNTNEKALKTSETTNQFGQQVEMLSTAIPLFLGSFKWTLYALFGYLAIINFLFSLLGYHLTTSPGILEKTDAKKR